MSKAEVAATGWKSMQLSTVSRLSGGKITYTDLADAIAQAAKRQQDSGP
jgi:hypothetical protein